MNLLDKVKVPNVQCSQYLIDGKITDWTGPSADVFSNIYLTKEILLINIVKHIKQME